MVTMGEDATLAAGGRSPLGLLIEFGVWNNTKHGRQKTRCREDTLQPAGDGTPAAWWFRLKIQQV